MSYAVIRTGGKQYRVSEGDQVRIEKIEGELGHEIEFGDVVLAHRNGEVIVDPDSLSQVKVVGKILRHGRGPKIRIFKFRRRKGYQHQAGHRQDFTEVRISSIA